MKHDAEFTWLVEHGAEIFEKYAGKWIAVHGDQIVGVGDTAVEADGAARQQVPDGDFVLEAVDFDADVIYGVP